MEDMICENCGTGPINQVEGTTMYLCNCMYHNYGKEKAIKNIDTDEVQNALLNVLGTDDLNDIIISVCVQTAVMRYAIDSDSKQNQDGVIHALSELNRYLYNNGLQDNNENTKKIKELAEKVN